MLVVPYDRMQVKSTKTNVFIKNLGPNVSNKFLYDLFKLYGEIFSVKLAQDYKGNSKGYGYVQYRNPEDSIKAINDMNGKEIDGRKLTVAPYKITERRDLSTQSYTNVFVKNLPPEVTTKAALDALFAEFGPRTSVGIFPKQLGDKMGYYGFVNFEKPEDAAKAVTGLNDKEISGVKLYVAKALTKDQRERERIRHKMELRSQSRKFTLHVKLKKGEPLDEALVRQELSPFGEIKSVSIQKSKNTEGQEIGSAIGYVVFAQTEEAERV